MKQYMHIQEKLGDVGDKVKEVEDQVKKIISELKTLEGANNGLQKSEQDKSNESGGVDGFQHMYRPVEILLVGEQKIKDEIQSIKENQLMPLNEIPR